MPKRVKIKRYNRIYRGSRSPSSLLFRGIGTVVAVCVLGFVGWSAYAPVMDYFTGLAASLEKPASISVLPAESQPEPAPEPEKPVAPAQLKAIYLPGAALSDAVKQEAVFTKMADDGLNAVMIDLKDTTGTVLYASSLEVVARIKSQGAAPLDLKSLCERAETHGISMIGRMSAFRDPLAGSKLTDAGVKYMGSNMLWLDNSKEAGGKPWLNPYSKIARAYLSDIAAEAIGLGVNEILLNDVSFPTGFGQHLSTYGDTAGVSRPDALSSFISEIETKVETAGGRLSVYVSGTAVLSAEDDYYGANPLTLTGTRVTLGVMPAQFGDGYTKDTLTLETPILKPRETVSTLLKSVSSLLEGKQVTALVQGYTETRVLTNNKPYTAEDIEAQLTALTDQKVESYIIYSPTGTYPQ